jgi:Flp pilus assembly protein TadG
MWRSRALPVGQQEGETGSSMVETAFSSIVMLLLVLVVFEFGMVFSSYIAVMNAARAGASYASIHASPSDPENGRYVAVARDEARAAHLDMAQLTVGPAQTPEGNEPGKPIQVTVSYRLSTFSSGISLPIFGRFGLPRYYTVAWTATAPIR